MGLRDFSRRDFMTFAASAACTALVPSVVEALPFQDPVVNTVHKDGKAISREKVQWKVQPFPMKQVRLGEGHCKVAMEADRQYLHSLPPDRLLHTFRLNAGLSSSAQPLGGWEAPDCELRGHYAGGHYLSAAALMYASTGDEDLKSKANTVVAELGKCQTALKSGYLSAFPVEFFDRLRDRERVWAPFYTIHKIMAGNLDMYVHCGNEQALDITEKMARWADGYTQPLSYDHMQRILGTEFGGMGEVLCNLYAVTGKEEYLEVAQRFDKKVFLDPLAAHRDELKGLHVNTHIPQVIAAARYYELTGDRRHRDIAQYFWEEVVSERTYCTGGTSNRESWNTDPGKLSTELGPTTTECCCAYNMMKLARHLYTWDGDPRFMDYYERALLNHRLGTIEPQTGHTSYFLSLAPGAWKSLCTEDDSFWCCTGTGVEEYAKLNNSIYFHDSTSLYVNLYFASQVNWRERGVKLRQQTEFPQSDRTELIVEKSPAEPWSLCMRIPAWTTTASVIAINGRRLEVAGTPGTYLAVTRRWKSGDRVELTMPMRLTAKPLADDPTRQAFLYGPLVLAGQFPKAGLPDALEHRQGADLAEAPPLDVPSLKARNKIPGDWIVRVDGEPNTFRTTGQQQDVTLKPLNQSWQRFAVYFTVT